MSDEWIGIIHSTRAKYIKGASDLTLRSRLLLAMLKRRGRIEFNQSGHECNWQVEFSQPIVSPYADGGLLDFANHDAFRQLTVGWRRYTATDTMTKSQRAMNKGEESLIDLFNTKQSRLMKAMQNNFAGELYKDGEATGRTSCIHGADTFTGVGTVAATDRVAQPSDTYAGISTALGNQGGSWSANASTFPNSTIASDWPDGQGESEYDFLTPKLVNWSSTNWGTGSALWEDNCWRVISQTITWLTINGGEEGMPDICVLAPNLFQGYKNHEEAIRRINIPHKTANDLGFAGNTLNQDGCAIQADFDCPYNTGHMFNTAKITISSLYPELFWMEGPDKDPRGAWGWLWGVGYGGQVKWQPKFTAKLKNYA